MDNLCLARTKRSQNSFAGEKFSNKGKGDGVWERKSYCPTATGEKWKIKEFKEIKWFVYRVIERLIMLHFFIILVTTFL